MQNFLNGIKELEESFGDEKFTPKSPGKGKTLNKRKKFTFKLLIESESPDAIVLQAT